jgi:lipopolysaccharide/colanic/teichoic acid biosynthesis glycosyltransferase
VSSTPSRKSLAGRAPDPLSTRVSPETDAFQRRFFDLGVAVLGLTVLGPLLAVLGVLIKLESAGPIFFIQKRVGLRRRRFDVIKFRSMRQPAADEDTLPSIDNIETFRFRPPNLESRVTVVGRALRQTSLDEVPNLLNVIRGDMNLVGPRPDEPEIVAQYRLEYLTRFRVKPGITGLAQVNGRADLTYQEIMAYDLAYAEKNSFKQDLRILLKSFGVVFRREGAR